MIRQNKQNRGKTDMKENNHVNLRKSEIIISFVIVLCPTLLGILLWKQLPDEIAVRFSMNNEAISYSPKGFAVFGIPIMMFVCHLFCILPIIIDPKNNQISRKLVLLLIWIIPILSTFLNGYILLYVLGIPDKMGIFLL